MKITTVVENVSLRDGLTEQYGLSLFVETASGNVLVDVGADGTARENFKALGFSLSDIHAVFLSHNHLDHLGGMASFLEELEDVPVYLSDGIGPVLLSKRPLHRRRVVSGNDLIETYREKLTFVADRVEILPSVYVCRVKAPEADFLCKDKKLRRLDEKGKMQADDFRHEAYLAVLEEGGVKIVSPCSHMGAVNIIRDAEARFGLPVKAFVGGLHLRGSSSRSINCSPKHIVAMAEAMRRGGLERLYTCHCTGFKAFRLLKNKMGEDVSLHYFHTGDVFTV